MRKLWLVLAVGAVAMGAIGAGPAQARLDPSFGRNGVVAVKPPLSSPWNEQFIQDLAAGHDGSSFALFRRQYCAYRVGCSSDYVVFRYASDGTLDPAFGSGGSYEVPPESLGIPTLAVDEHGRLLLASFGKGNQVLVWRLTTSGALDRSFDVDGSVGFQCSSCSSRIEILPGPAGALALASAQPKLGAGRFGTEMTGTTVTLVRLRADGSRDGRFGSRGIARFSLRGAESFSAAEGSRSGTLYLAGGGCCGANLSGYLVRISARGRLDRRFTLAARRSLAPLNRLALFQAPINEVLVRRRGAVDLLGSIGYGKGFIVQLKPNGRRDRRFGRQGARKLPLPVQSAGLGSAGATMAVSGLSGVVFRILPGGRLDPAFGRKRLPGGGAHGGISIVPQSKRRALVLDPGLSECRGYCPATPQLVRFLEEPRKRR